MAHEVETMAWAGEVPWHGLGNKVSNDLTAEEMRAAAGLSWDVIKQPCTYQWEGKTLRSGKSALIRNSDGERFDVVSDSWEPMTNTEIAEFFHDFVQGGGVSMETAGSLQGGKIVWMLAKVKDGFTLFGRDETELFLLVTTHHTYGKASDVRGTPIRVVCANTLAQALGKKGDLQVSVSHRKKFDPEAAKQALVLSQQAFGKYKEAAKFISEKSFRQGRFAKDWTKVETYFDQIFPFEGKVGTDTKIRSQAALVCSDLLDSQPGADYGAGTWWSAFNAITFYADHVYGRTQDSRLVSSWYGENRRKKQLALDLALEFARGS